MPFVAGAVTGIAWTVYIATINPTVGAAIVGAMTTLAQTALMLWHDRRVDRRMRERRLVVLRQDDSMTIGDEERRQLEDRRGRLADREGRERRRRKRRGDT